MSLTLKARSTQSRKVVSSMPVELETEALLDGEC